MSAGCVICRYSISTAKISSEAVSCLRASSAIPSTYQRGLLRCLSLLGRQCEGLGTWDKQQVQIPTSFHFKQYLKPLGLGNLREMALMM